MTTVSVITVQEVNSYQTEETHAVQYTKWRNRPQLAAMISAAMLFIAGGMDLAFGLGWNQQTGLTTTDQLQFSWFIGFIAGALIAAPLIPYLQKRFYLIISALLVLACGIVYVSLPHDYTAILIVRYVSGIAIGFCIVAFIVHGSEVAASSYRGAVLSLEQYAFTFGIAIQVIYSSQWTSYAGFAANRLHGIFLIVFALIALASVYFVIESPIFYLRQYNEEAALECLCQLQRPQIITNHTKALLDSLKSYVLHEQNQTVTESLRKAIYPFVKTLLYRSMVAFTFSIVLTYAIIVASYFSMGYANSWPPIVFILLRVFGTFLSLWIVDGLGRKLVSLFSLLCIGGLTIAVGIIFSNSSNLIDSHKMSTICTLMLVAQFFAGLFVPSTSVYLGEAFPLTLKPYLVACCVSVEQIIQIIGIITFRISIYNAYVYCITVGIVMCALFIYFYLAIPETRNTTLSEAQKRFRHLLYMKMY